MMKEQGIRQSTLKFLKAMQCVISTLGTTRYKSVGEALNFFWLEHRGGLYRSKGTFIYHILVLCMFEGGVLNFLLNDQRVYLKKHECYQVGDWKFFASKTISPVPPIIKLNIDLFPSDLTFHLS